MRKSRDLLFPFLARISSLPNGGNFLVSNFNCLIHFAICISLFPSSAGISSLPNGWSFLGSKHDFPCCLCSCLWREFPRFLQTGISPAPNLTSRYTLPSVFPCSCFWQEFPRLQLVEISPGQNSTSQHTRPSVFLCSCFQQEFPCFQMAGISSAPNLTS
jgi:hypothetical protein